MFNNNFSLRHHSDITKKIELYTFIYLSSSIHQMKIIQFSLKNALLI